MPLLGSNGDQNKEILIRLLFGTIFSVSQKLHSIFIRFYCGDIFHHLVYCSTIGTNRTHSDFAENYRKIRNCVDNWISFEENETVYILSWTTPFWFSWPLYFRKSQQLGNQLLSRKVKKNFPILQQTYELKIGQNQQLLGYFEPHFWHLS